MAHLATGLLSRLLIFYRRPDLGGANQTPILPPPTPQRRRMDENADAN